MCFTCSRDSYIAISLYLVFRAGDVFIDVLHGVDQQHQRMDYCGISMIIRATLFLVAFIIGLGYFDSLEIALFGMVIATYPVIIYDYEISSRFTDVRPSFNLSTSKHFSHACPPSLACLSVRWSLPIPVSSWGSVTVPHRLAFMRLFVRRS